MPRMAASSRMRAGPWAVLACGSAAAILLIADPSSADLLPWEVAVAEIESGRLRGLAERLRKQNVLYQLHLGDASKEELIATAERIDDVLRSLQKGSPSYSVPAPWTPALREQLAEVDEAWGPIRRMAVASPYDYLRVTRQFMQPEDRRGDPLRLRYFDELAGAFIAASEELLELYHGECRKTGLTICDSARSSGYAVMVIERAARQAVYVVAGIDADKHRSGLAETIEAYQAFRHANDESPFFAEALDPARGRSASAARELLVDLRGDWDDMQAEFTLLAAGDERNFDLGNLLAAQGALVDKVERLTAALIRYASLTYGS